MTAKHLKMLYCLKEAYKREKIHLMVQFLQKDMSEVVCMTRNMVTSCVHVSRLLRMRFEGVSSCCDVNVLISQIKELSLSSSTYNN